MGGFGTIVQPFMTAMLDARQHLLMRCRITAELVPDQHPRDVLAPGEQLAENFLGRRLVPSALYQDI